MSLIEELTDELVVLQQLCFLGKFGHPFSDLSVSETHAIEALGQHGTMNMKSLASRLGVTTGTVTVTVDRLESRITPSDLHEERPAGQPHQPDGEGTAGF